MSLLTHLPAPVQRLAERIRVRALFGRDAPLIPVESLMHDGPQGYREFRDNGREFLGHYRDLCGLKPNESVLDVGSGIGRKTFALTRYLDRRARYVGIDTYEPGIAWCTERYTQRFPNFTFNVIDVRNGAYNPGGTVDAADYRFPFADGEFDLVVLNSVVTHMLPAEVANYLHETARVLRPGGRCFISWFVLNDESVELIDAGKSTLELRHAIGPARAVRADRPEQAIGYDEAFMRDAYAAAGLRIRAPIHYGSWCGRTRYLSYQDLIVADKPR